MLKVFKKYYCNWNNIFISLGHLSFILLCKKTPKTKFAFVRVEPLSRPDINASDYTLVSTSVLFERTLGNSLELAFQDGYCVFSMNKSLNCS